MLANFQVDGRSLFQSFLLGQEELRRTLQLPNMEQLRQRIIAAYHLDPLSLEETSAYIAFRLNRVGWSGDPEFAPEVFELVHARTGGVPRRINTLCDRLMLFGCIEERHQLTRDDVRVVAAELEQESGRLTGGEVRTTVAESGTAAATDAGGGGLTPGDLGERLSSLEAEVSRLRLIVMQERKLLRKAVLLQLELDAYDDLD